MTAPRERVRAGPADPAPEPAPESRLLLYGAGVLVISAIFGLAYVIGRLLA